MGGGGRLDPISSEAGEGAAIEALLPRRRLVVVIGIDHYARLPGPRCAVSDALGVQELLVKRFGFEAPLPPLINQAATRAAIEALLEDDLWKVVEPGDALVLFFAGLGATRAARVDEMLLETGYIIPADARSASHFSDLINTEELLRRSGMLPARHILVVLDACQSGFALGSTVSQYRSAGSYVHRLIGNRSRRVITSARRGELAHDTGPLPNCSLFAGALIHALSTGEADVDANGFITFSELALFLQQRVAQASGSKQTPDYGAFHLDDRGELVLDVRGGEGNLEGSLVAPGTVIAERYRVDQQLKLSHDANICAATDLRAGARVTLTLFYAGEKKKLTAARARLKREAEALRLIRSRYVPRLLEITSDKRYGFTIVVEPLAGEPLLTQLQRRGPIPFRELHPLIEQVWRGLLDIHKAGVIHRDIKPSNLLVERGLDGVTRVKIIGFGVCKISDNEGEPGAVTEPGQSLGTFSFMPPEQIGAASLADERADIYACSTLIFQALSGALPYAARDLRDMVDLKRGADPRRLSEAMPGPVDPALEAFLSRGLARDPAARIQTAEEALAAWRRLLPGAG